MDMTVEYVNMCREAEEIQKLWNPKYGDFAYLPDIMEYFLGKLKKVSKGHHSDMLKDWVIEDIKKNKEIRKYFVWLPRQDQLQEILIQSRHPDKDVSEHFCGFYLYHDILDWYRIKMGEIFYQGKDFINFNSLEQMWLAFVMYEKYNKVWDKKEWRIKK